MFFGSGFGPEDIRDNEWLVSYGRSRFQVTCSCPGCGSDVTFVLEGGKFPFETIIRCKLCRTVAEYTVKVTAKILNCEEAK